MQNHPQVDNPFQTYLVHTQKKDITRDPDLWFQHQSNVHGIVVAANVLSEDAIDQYPKMVDSVVEHFIPDLTVVEEDFTEVKDKSSKRRLDVLTFSGDNKRSFLSAVQIGLEYLRDAFLVTKCKKEASYVGSSYGAIAAALELCDEEATETAGDQVDIAMSGTLRTAQAINRMQRLPEDLRKNHNPNKPWESTENWVINNDRSRMIQKSDVSVLGKDPANVYDFGTA